MNDISHGSWMQELDASILGSNSVVITSGICSLDISCIINVNLSSVNYIIVIFIICFPAAFAACISK